MKAATGMAKHLRVDREWHLGGLAEWKPILVDLGCRLRLVTRVRTFTAHATSRWYPSARSPDVACLVQLPRKTAHKIFAGERWTTLHGVNADFCQALAPLGEFFAGSKISRLI